MTFVVDVSDTVVDVDVRGSRFKVLWYPKRYHNDPSIYRSKTRIAVYDFFIPVSIRFRKGSAMILTRLGNQRIYYLISGVITGKRFSVTIFSYPSLFG